MGLTAAAGLSPAAVQTDEEEKHTLTYFCKLNFFMEIKTATAGTLESGDVMVQISPAEGEGLHIELESTVALQFGEQIRQVATEALTDFGLTNAHVRLVDKGALDCTIRARVTAAAVRATGKDVWKD